MLKLQPKDLEDATVVMLYIGDDLGKRVSPVLKNSLKPGSRIVSTAFCWGIGPGPDREAQRRRQRRLHDSPVGGPQEISLKNNHAKE